MRKSRPLSTALGLALLGSLPVMADTNPSFTAKPLAAGYLLAATDADKNAEGTCGEGACGEGMCAASMKAKATASDPTKPVAPSATPATPPASDEAGGKHDAEGSCGEGKCGKM